MICRFGGNGSVLNIHEHSSSDHTYNVTSGLMRDEAVDLFRQFYNGENERGETRNVCINDVQCTVLSHLIVVINAFFCLHSTRYKTQAQKGTRSHTIITQFDTIIL